MPQRIKYEDLSPERKADVDAYRARMATPEHRAEMDRVRKLAEQEYPPVKASPVMMAAIADLRAERERLGLSLTDVAARSRIDRALLSRLENGKVFNPTIWTLIRYAAAVGMELKLLACPPAQDGPPAPAPEAPAARRGRKSSTPA